jgi:ribonuclease III
MFNNDKFEITDNKSNIILPYNTENILLKPDDVTLMFKKFKINIIPNDITIYQEALTHISYTKNEYINIDPTILINTIDNTINLFDKSNERLEFLGDTVIKCIFSEYLFKRFDTEDEGFLTRLKTKIEDKDSLARYAKRLGIEQYLIISKYIEENNGRHSIKLLEDVFEAFIGALFIDLGFEVCKKFLTIILETDIDYASILYQDTNYKDQLLKFYHKNKWSHPIYVEIKSDGPIHKRIFTMGVKNHNDEIITQASDISKKKAEQKCALLALLKYNQINHDQIPENIDI